MRDWAIPGSTTGVIAECARDAHGEVSRKYIPNSRLLLFDKRRDVVLEFVVESARAEGAGVVEACAEEICWIEFGGTLLFQKCYVLPCY